MNSQQQYFILAPCICTGTQACPFGTVDDYLMDTSNWTAEEWGAATILAETLRMRNAKKESRDTGGASNNNNQGAVRGMWQGPTLLCPAVMTAHS